MSDNDAGGWEDFLDDPTLACSSIYSHFNPGQSNAQAKEKCRQDNDDNDKNDDPAIPADSYWELVKLGLARPTMLALIEETFLMEKARSIAIQCHSRGLKIKVVVANIENARQFGDFCRWRPDSDSEPESNESSPTDSNSNYDPDFDDEFETRSENENKNLHGHQTNDAIANKNEN